jgi:dipeptidyl aminopeptidase/acylaminoacyl peptidase
MPQFENILQLPIPVPGKRIPYGVDSLQFGELRLPAGFALNPVVIVIHGGFWRAAYNLDHIGHLCMALNHAGVATWSLEYRRLGNTGGGWPGTFDDIAAGANHLESIAEEHHLDLNRIIALGHSAGGQLALWLAARYRLNGVVSLAGVADLRRAHELKLSNTVVVDLLGGTPMSVPDRYHAASPIELLPLRVPQRLIHGTLDEIVPLEISKTYTDAAQSVGDDAELIPLEGAGHFELIDPRTREFETVENTVLRLLHMTIEH